MTGQNRLLADPVVDAGNAPYFAAAGEGRLLLRKCGDCGRLHHYPRAICPFCMSLALEWTQAAGTGTVYAYTVTRRGGPFVYVLAYVTLDEGLSMLSNIVRSDPDDVAVGRRVRMTSMASESGVHAPVFELV